MENKKMNKTPPLSCMTMLQLLCSLVLLFLVQGFSCIEAVRIDREIDVSIDAWGSVGGLVKREERRILVSTEFGDVSAVDIGDGLGREFHLQFIRLDPNALFLPVLLHADMVFYVHTGAGLLSWTNDGKLLRMRLERGDLFRLEAGNVFYLHSGLEPERERLRINAIFTSSNEESQQVPSLGVYSSINDLIRGFDRRTLQAAFKVPEEVIEELISGAKTPPIIHAAPTRQKKNLREKEALVIKAVLGMGYNEIVSDTKNKKKSKTFNFFREDPDFQNCNGWSTAVSQKHLHILRGSSFGAFMVNLSRGVMMGPHWNPMATEISVVLQGQGMVRVVCPSTLTDQECNSSRLRVKEGDVFTVPRFHAMTQISFNNESFVFMGFSTSTARNHPQFLAGKASVLRVLDKHVMEAAFNVANTTLDQIIATQAESVILDCISCAEEEEMLLEQEIEREREVGRAREEEEARRRQEEEERRAREEEERRREEEERRRQEEEEESRREEEVRQREEEEEQQPPEEEEPQPEEEEGRPQEEETEHEEEAGEEEQEEERIAKPVTLRMTPQRGGEKESKWVGEKMLKNQMKGPKQLKHTRRVRVEKQEKGEKERNPGRKAEARRLLKARLKP
ncbi:Vicilin-like seed storage protein-like protein [Drosera capensis]